MFARERLLRRMLMSGIARLLSRQSTGVRCVPDGSESIRHGDSAEIWRLFDTSRTTAKRTLQGSRHSEGVWCVVEEDRSESHGIPARTGQLSPVPAKGTRPMPQEGELALACEREATSRESKQELDACWTEGGLEHLTPGAPSSRRDPRPSVRLVLQASRVRPRYSTHRRRLEVDGS